MEYFLTHTKKKENNLSFFLVWIVLLINEAFSTIQKI